MRGPLTALRYLQTLKNEMKLGCIKSVSVSGPKGRPKHRGQRVRRNKERLTAHGVQSHQAANEIVKVHVAVLIAIATDNQLEELVIQRETCTHTRLV